ncbi:DNA polymerase III subunit beta [Kineococcus aurantiacus]|uniref:Beta sliding clamp n=1 Tax=Kineococcus aurantiacus TaxID=37633 RepID=A0A7Y9J136_9ACTN|nr:DNA polymerase-3 subunit beta [Kineococcus aurantiacus]
MELQVERDVLADAVAWAARALPSRPPVPVLAGVLLEATDEGALKLSTFDYEVSARVELPADVRTAGRVLVSGRLLADISRSLPNRPVTLTTEGSKVVVTCGASRFTLLTMTVDEYPALPQLPDASGQVAGGEFTEAVAQVTIAASRDETLPILTGVRMEIEGDKLTLLATDRYRLAVRELRWNPSTPDISAVALVRARTLSDVARSLGSSSSLTLALADGKSDLIGFQAGGRYSTSLLVDGEYPKVRALFPAESPTHAVVSTAALTEAVKRVALVAERNTPVRLRFEDGVLSLEAGQGEDAQATEALEATLVGESIAIAFNPQFLLDGLGALAAPFARLSFTQATRPAVLTGQQDLDGDDDDSYRYLLMPVRLAG